MLKPYLGELLLVPYPLELSLVEPCDYGCRYCFAILGDRARRNYKGGKKEANGLRDTVQFLSTAHKRRSLEAHLFNHRYPVLMSNRTDPFGRKNRAATISLLELFQDMEVPVAFQTKGFIQHEQDFERVMAMVKPSHWYISISFLNDSDRARVEPGAPPIEYRWELAAELIRRGHVVSIGWNPFVPEWVELDGDPYKGAEVHIQRMIDAGVKVCAIQPLHLHSSNKNQMTERELQDLSNGDMNWLNSFAGKKSIPAHWDALYRHVSLRLYQEGISSILFDSGWEQPTWDATHALYPKTLPTIADFRNHCARTKKIGDPVTFDEWWQWLKAWPLPDITAGLGHAIRIQSWTLCDKITKQEGWAKWKTNMDYKTLFRIAWQWQDRLGGLTPIGCSAFCYAVDGSGNLVADDNMLPVLAYAPAPDHPLDYYGSWQMGS
ncbi:MAG: hypothetical protein ACO3S8_07250 [Aquiluna sp.]